jgi:hypothetical protein
MQLGRMNLPLQMLLAPYKLIIMNTHISFLGMLGNSVTLPFAIFQTLNNYGMAPSTCLWHGPHLAVPYAAPLLKPTNFTIKAFGHV